MRGILRSFTKNLNLRQSQIPCSDEDNSQNVVGTIAKECILKIDCDESPYQASFARYL
jgi:hypothetical protein